MQAHKLTAGQGWRWLLDGFRIYRRNPPLMTLIVLSYWMLLAFVNLVPVLGPIAVTVCLPAFSVGLAYCARALDRRQPLEFGMLFAGFRQNLPRQLVLGGLYFGATMVALGLSALADGGTFVQAVTGTHQPTEDEIGSASSLAAALITTILMTPMLAAWWYAPVLAAWHDMPAGKALFFSFAAFLRNWRAFLAYGLSVMLLGALLPGFVLGLTVSLLPETADFITALISVPLLFILLPTLIASFYVTYRDVFVAGGDA